MNDCIHGLNTTKTVTARTGITLPKYGILVVKADRKITLKGQKEAKGIKANRCSSIPANKHVHTYTKTQREMYTKGLLLSFVSNLLRRKIIAANETEFMVQTSHAISED